MTSNDHPIRANLTEKGNFYYAIFSYKNSQGKENRKWFSLGLDKRVTSRRKALDAMEELKFKMKNVIDVPGYSISFEDYLLQWLEQKNGKLREYTYESYQNTVKNKIIRYFAPKKLMLSEVRPKHIHEFYEYLYRSGRSDGKGLSISGIKSIKSMLNNAFKKAIVEGLVTNNPVISVSLPAKDNPRKPYTVLNRESAGVLLGHIADDPLMYPLLCITLHYGLRKSEVLGLKWSAIDFQNNQLEIRSTITKGKNPEYDKTKTLSSQASFPLLDDVVNLLMIRKQDQEARCQAAGSAYEKNDYVFTTDTGKHLSPGWVTERFHEILRECGLPKMRFHDLRHSTCCILYEEGMGIKELQQWMRHAKLEMTADVYLHASKKREEALANGLRNLFSQPLDKQQITQKTTFGIA